MRTFVSLRRCCSTQPGIVAVRGSIAFRSSTYVATSSSRSGRISALVTGARR